uniref:Phytocyanin domain-containing protein n=1 Tax=Kalanchoe fedtschenkoi TaxID=63787 RepID=A0A7N0UII7_KALFE
MGDLRKPGSGINTNKLLYVFKILLLLAAAYTEQVHSKQYKVGDLDAWGIPTAANPHVYTTWSKKHDFKIGDSLLFLYPPSQDSVIQVREGSFKTCNLEDPILHMDDGNSLFNITSNGTFYFTSGEAGHCGKQQKLQISIGEGEDAASDGPSSSADVSSPSYQPAFGTIPSPSSAAPSLMSITSMAAVIIIAVFSACVCQFLAGFEL